MYQPGLGSLRTLCTSLLCGLLIIPLYIMDLFEKVKNSITFCSKRYRLYPVGSILRGKTNPKDVDIIMKVKKISDILSTIEPIDDDVKITVKREGTRFIAFILYFEPRTKKHSVPFYTNSIHVDIWLSTEEEFPFMLLSYGAGREYNVRVRALAKKRGYVLNNYGIFDRTTGKRVKGKFKEVRDIQRFLNITERDISTGKITDNTKG